MNPRNIYCAVRCSVDDPSPDDACHVGLSARSPSLNALRRDSLLQRQSATEQQGFVRVYIFSAMIRETIYLSQQ